MQYRQVSSLESPAFEPQFECLQSSELKKHPSFLLQKKQLQDNSKELVKTGYDKKENGERTDKHDCEAGNTVESIFCRNQSISYLLILPKNTEQYFKYI